MGLKFNKILVINQGIQLKSADIHQSKKISNKISNKIILYHDQELTNENVSEEGEFI